MSLCTACSQIELETVLTHFTPAQNAPGSLPFYEAPLYTLRKSAGTCKLCELFLSVVTFHAFLLPKADPAIINCTVVAREYGVIHSHTVGRPADPVNGLSREQRSLKSITRLHIKVFVGDGKAINLPCGLQLKAKENSTTREVVMRGRNVPPTVHLGVIKSWIERCTRHGTYCTPTSISEQADGLTRRVIDMEQMCIINLPHGQDYFALSYVWGTAAQLCLLPDAIHLTQNLGGRYLWVDALCIVQDDVSDVAAQIQHMHDVYGCAALTIVAAFGVDSNAGLPGLKPGTRKSLDLDTTIQGIQLVTAYPDFVRSLSASVWESRGWTMQEKVLSKRLIIFTEYQVFYHCSSATFCEDAFWETEDPCFFLKLAQLSPALARIPLPPRNYNGMRKYAHFVPGYHTRLLTHESDALNAFTGALTALSQELGTSFVWGLPTSEFEGAITWRTIFHNPDARRKQFPSWSWLGWRHTGLPGGINFPAITDEYVETVPLIQWHQVDEKNQQIPLENVLSERRDLPDFVRPEALPDLQTDHLLRFWASSAMLYASRKPLRSHDNFSEFGCYMYAVNVKKNGRVQRCGTIYLHDHWRKSQLDALEFIAVCRRKVRNVWDKNTFKEGVDLMLIEMEHAVSSRVQFTGQYVNEQLWQDAEPVWKVITLA